MVNKKHSETGLLVKKISCKIAENIILHQLDLRVTNGETCLIIGPSGSGKTTLLSVLAGIQKPAEGEVLYNGLSLYGLNENQRDQFRGQHIGMLFQTFHLVKPLSVRQNILLPTVLSGKEPDLSCIDDLLNRLGLATKSDQKVATLSVGEAQRLALARALIMKPKWLFCDEPTSSLDDSNAKNMLSLIEHEAKHSGASLIIVTHDNRVKEHLNANQVIELGMAQ